MLRPPILERFSLQDRVQVHKCALDTSFQALRQALYDWILL